MRSKYVKNAGFSALTQSSHKEKLITVYLVDHNRDHRRFAMKTISALLVHESEIFLDILGKLVADISGPKITTVKTCAGFRGVIALARASNSNLVIHDLGLPNLRGLPTIYKLRSEIPNIIIIALTSVVSAAYKAEAIQAGANKVIYTGSIFWELEPAILRAFESRGRNRRRGPRARRPG